MFQRSVPQALPSDSEQINDCSCSQVKDQVLIFVPLCGTSDLYLWCTAHGRYLCLDCLSQEGVGGTEERQLLFPLRCPLTRRQLCDLFSSYPLPAVFMVPHSPKKRQKLHLLQLWSLQQMWKKHQHRTSEISGTTGTDVSLSNTMTKICPCLVWKLLTSYLNISNIP